MKTLFKTALMCVALAATAVSVSCNDPIEEPPATIKVTSVELGETELSLQTGEAETATLVATVLPADADNKVVTWESSDDEVVSIAPDGLVCVLTALKEGAATITTEASKPNAL